MGSVCNRDVSGYLGALSVPADSRFKVFKFSGILDIPSYSLSVWTITLSGCMERRSNYIHFLLKHDWHITG